MTSLVCRKYPVWVNLWEPWSPCVGTVRPSQPTDLQSESFELIWRSECTSKRQISSDPYFTQKYFIILLGICLFFFLLLCFWSPLLNKCIQALNKINRALCIWRGGRSTMRGRNWNEGKFKVALIRNGKTQEGAPNFIIKLKISDYYSLISDAAPWLALPPVATFNFTAPTVKPIFMLPIQHGNYWHFIWGGGLGVHPPPNEEAERPWIKVKLLLSWHYALGQSFTF